MGLTGSRQCAVIERCQKKIRDVNLSLISTGRLYIVGMLRGDDSFVSSYNYCLLYTSPSPRDA